MNGIRELFNHSKADSVRNYIGISDEDMSKKEYLNYIIDYAVHTGWEDWNGKDQIRSLFTSWCLIFRIDADTKECDEALNVIYWRAAMEELIDYEDYERFMVEFIV